MPSRWYAGSSVSSQQALRSGSLGAFSFAVFCSIALHGAVFGIVFVSPQTESQVRTGVPDGAQFAASFVDFSGGAISPHASEVLPAMPHAQPMRVEQDVARAVPQNTPPVAQPTLPETLNAPQEREMQTGLQSQDIMVPLPLSVEQALVSETMAQQEPVLEIAEEPIAAAATAVSQPAPVLPQSFSQPAENSAFIPMSPAAQPVGVEEVASYSREVLARIQQTPRVRHGSPGRVHIKFTISGDGSVNAIDVIQSSGSTSLDNISIDHVLRSAPFPTPPAYEDMGFTFEYVE